MKYKFLCGNAFKSTCRYSVGKYINAREHDFDFTIKEGIDNDAVFIKTEYVGNFFQYINLEKPFHIYTHNSDIPIDGRFSKFLDDPRVLSWRGQNVNIEHEKVTPIPIGLANP